MVTLAVLLSEEIIKTFNMKESRFINSSNTLTKGYAIRNYDLTTIFDNGLSDNFYSGRTILRL